LKKIFGWGFSTPPPPSYVYVYSATEEGGYSYWKRDEGTRKEKAFVVLTDQQQTRQDKAFVVLTHLQQNNTRKGLRCPNRSAAEQDKRRPLLS